MKKNLTILLALLAIAAMAQAQVNTPPVAPDVEAAVTSLRKGLVDSFNRGDIDQLLTYLDTNAVVTWQNGEVCEGAGAVKAYYERMMTGDHPVVSKVTADPKVLGRHFQGDWAISWGNLNDTFVLTDGRELALNSHFTATIARRGDRWLVTAFHVSVNAFDNPVMSLAVKKVSLFAGVGGAAVGFIGGLLVMLLLRRAKSGGGA
jgi:ketosteroid isomerase-like protein